MNSIFTEIELLSSLTLKTKEVLKTNIIILQWAGPLLQTCLAISLNLVLYYGAEIKLYARLAVPGVWEEVEGWKMASFIFKTFIALFRKPLYFFMFLKCLRKGTISIQRELTKSKMTRLEHNVTKTCMNLLLYIKQNEKLYIFQLFLSRLFLL